MLSICLFGHVQTLVDGRSIAITRRKSRALLYYVAAQAEPVSRRRLLALLWTDYDDHSARNNLRSTLYSLRQDLGDLLVADNDLLALDNSSSVDVRTFATTLGAPAVQLPTLAAALALYRGDFLREFSLPDSPEYEDWVAAEREQYRRTAIRGFAKLGRLHAEAGDYHAAVAALQQALDLDPFQEDLQRDSLYMHYLAGDRAGAIRRFDELRHLLEEELGVPPMAETQALYDAIITDQLAVPASPSVASSPLPPAATPAPARQAPSTFPPQPITKKPAAKPTLPAPALALPPGDEALPFAGRTAELAQIRAAVGSGQLVLVEGEAGIGKTRLVSEFLRTLSHQDDRALLLLSGRARELEDRLPYQPVIEALRSLQRYWNWERLRETLTLHDIWRDEVARLLPELFEPERNGFSHQAAARKPDESRLWEGLFQLLAELAQQTQLYFFIDDLHWADVATLGMLGYLIRQAAQSSSSIYFLAATRPVPQRAESTILQQSLRREDLLVRVSLERLRAAEMAELARQLSPQFAVPLSQWLTRGSEGNPFVLEELVRYARQNRILSAAGVVDLAALPASPVVPQTVYTLIQARLEQLSESARRILDAAVALGREFEYEVAARAAALSDIAALDALDELRRVRLIHVLDDSRFAFDHSLIMEVAYREVGEPRHRLLHRRLAAALESIYQHQLDEVAGLIAQHYREGNAPELAAPYARRAGDRAMRLAAWKAAADFYEQALGYIDESERTKLLVAVARANLFAGNVSRAADAAHEAFEREDALARAHIDARDSGAASATPPVGRDEPTASDQPVSSTGDVTIVADALSLLSEALLHQARYAEIMELAQRLRANEGPMCRQATIQFITEYMWGTALSMEGLHLDRAIEHLQAAAEQLRRNAAAPIESMAQVDFELGNLEAQQGNLNKAIAHYRSVLAQTEEVESDDGLRFHIMAHNNLGYHLHLLEDPAALDFTQKGLTLARDKGLLALTPFLYSTLGEIALAQDELSNAESYFSLGLASAQQFQMPERIAGLTANLGLVAFRRGQRAEAIAHLERGLALAETARARFLAARIQILLASVLPADAAEPHLAAAREAVEYGNYLQLVPLLESIASDDSAPI